MKLIFVYLGKDLPKYVLANIRQIQGKFPDREIVFIGDDPLLCKKMAGKGIDTWLSPTPELNWVLNRSSLSHDPDFRNGFWFKTLARFYSLNEYMKLFPFQSVLLIESDVWISPSFPFRKFEQGCFDCAYPLAGKKQGVASTFFIRNSKCMQTFLEFAEQATLLNPEETDVTILGSFFRFGALNTVVLPSAINIKESFGSHVDVDEIVLMTSEEFFEDGIFDASTWGQFLTGLDPRNSWGFRRIYFHQESHSVNPTKFTFSAIGDELLVNLSGMSKRIYSLHIHSKDLRVFKKRGFLTSRVINSGNGPRNEVVLKYVVRFLPSRFLHVSKRTIQRISGIS